MNGTIVGYDQHSGKGSIQLEKGGPPISFLWSEISIAPEVAKARGVGHIPDAPRNQAVRVGDQVNFDPNRSNRPFEIIGGA